VAAVVIGWLVWPKAPGQAVLRTGTSHYVVTVTIDNPKVGNTAVDVDLTGRAGGPANATGVRTEAVMPLMGHATQPVPAVPVGGGRYHADGVSLMMAGQWELLVSIDFTGGVDQLTLPLMVSG
jgi:nitrogen fixation protein FixH